MTVYSGILTGSNGVTGTMSINLTFAPDEVDGYATVQYTESGNSFSGSGSDDSGSTASSYLGTTGGIEVIIDFNVGGEEQGAFSFGGTFNSTQSTISGTSQAINYDTGTVSQFSTTLYSQGLPPIISFSSGSLTTGPGTATFTLSRGPVPIGDTGSTVDISTVNGTAVAGKDFGAINDMQIVFAPGQSTATFTDTVLYDSADAAANINPDFSIVLSNPTNASIGFATANVTINEAANVINDSITKLYIGYYDRAPDPAGETYWVGQLQGGMSLSAIAQSYSVQTESTNLYPFLASPNTASTAAVQAFVTSVYENLFNRAPDPAGEAYWVTQLQTGASTVGGAIINIISGAQLNDLATINNKVTVGDYFDTQIFTHNVQFSASVALAAFNAVTFNTSSIATAEAIVNTYVATASLASQAATASQAEVNVVGISPNHDLAVAA